MSSLRTSACSIWRRYPAISGVQLYRSEALRSSFAQRFTTHAPQMFEHPLAHMSDSDMTRPEHMKAGRVALHRHAEEAGRDIKHFELGVTLAPGFEDPDLLRIYDDDGADRVAFSLQHIEPLDDAYRALEVIASRIL